MHDVQWSPKSENFIVISGKMPATITLYSKNCVPTFEFGKLHLNTIRYSPHNDVILLGGFGSLAGNMQFWDYESLELIGKTKSHCAVVTEWAPDSRHFLTSVLYHRVKVENEFSIYNNYGKKILNHKLSQDDKMIETHWQPHDPSAYPEGREVPMLDDVFEDEEEKKTSGSRKLELPKSAAFASMMAATMTSSGSGTTESRRLKGDEYKEFMVETEEEMKGPKAKPKKTTKKKAAAPSWRSGGGFAIPEGGGKKK